ncbi:hypothetical protein EH223_14965 [candidate division KSB1 bacterium]|nr:hypothetical protein [candidate division KSB1 bacterium]RQW01465.1 MAG: hypothetical protein EH223_14965 [candidate division KSB1 bacterium]
MKNLAGIMILILFVTFTVEAKMLAVDEARLNTFMTNIDLSLNSENDGVRFWAMFLLARLKSDMPEIDLTRFNRTLTRMVDRDKEELLRVNAKMTYLYLNEPELVKEVRVLDRENPLIFYAQLYLAKYNEKFNLENVSTLEQIKELSNQIEELEKQM